MATVREVYLERFRAIASKYPGIKAYVDQQEILSAVHVRDRQQWQVEFDKLCDINRSMPQEEFAIVSEIVEQAYEGHNLG